MNGKDLSSLNKMLNLGLYFLIKFASKSKASLSLDVVVISSPNCLRQHSFSSNYMIFF